MYTLDKVIDGLYIGNEVASSRKELLQRTHITHILAAGYGLKSYFPDCFVYKQMDMLDMPTYEIHRHFSECNAFIDGALESGGSVLVHCFQGVSRSTTVVSAYLMFKQRLTAPEALKLLKERHFDTDPNFGFVYQLNQYEAMLKSGEYLSAPTVGEEDKVYCKCEMF